MSNNPAIAARRGAAAPALDLEEAGCRIGIGTDNMAEDMVEAIRTGYFVERVRRDDPFSPTPEKMLEWGTIGGARIMGMDETLGSLEVGKQADLFVADLAPRPHGSGAEARFGLRQQRTGLGRGGRHGRRKLGHA